MGVQDQLGCRHFTSTRSSRARRRRVTGWRLTSRGVPDDVAECAALLTSELVTNAVLHAATPLTVTLHLMADRIRVDVADGSPAIPAIKQYAPMRRPDGA